MNVLIFFLLLVSVSVLADELKPFSSDGCSSFPNGTPAQKELWLSCCQQHDYEYWKGGTYAERLASDEALEKCVAQVGEPGIATLMLAGVRIGGMPYFPTTFRWGYGWPYPRLYSEFTEAEQQQITKLSDALALTTPKPVSTVAKNSGSDTADARDKYFTDWPAEADPATVGQKAANIFLNETLPEPKHYKVACVWYGSLAHAAVINDQALLNRLIAKYDTYKNSWDELLNTSGHVDNNVFGIVPLEIAQHSNDRFFLREGLQITAHQHTHIETQIRYAIDDMFMITALQVQAYRASGNIEHLNLAAATMVKYLERLQQEDGLFHHHEDIAIKWARGNGWFAAGMTELMRELPQSHHNFAAISAGYHKMMRGLLRYQIANGEGAGLWKQVIDAQDAANWPETSGSAMFAYALITGVREGWLDVDTYGPVARATWLGLVAYLTPEGQLNHVANWAWKPAGDEGISYYFNRAKLVGDNHGQAPLVWSATALIRPLTPDTPALK